MRPRTSSLGNGAEWACLGRRFTAGASIHHQPVWGKESPRRLLGPLPPVTAYRRHAGAVRAAYAYEGGTRWHAMRPPLG